MTPSPTTLQPDHKGTIQSNHASITPLWYSTKLLGHTTVHTPASPTTIPKQDSSKEHIDDIEPQDSASQISKTLTLLSNILKQFKDKLLQKTAEFEKSLQEQREKLLDQYQALKTETSTQKQKQKHYSKTKTTKTM